MQGVLTVGYKQGVAADGPGIQRNSHRSINEDSTAISCRKGDYQLRQLQQTSVSAADQLPCTRIKSNLINGKCGTVVAPHQPDRMTHGLSVCRRIKPTHGKTVLQLTITRDGIGGLQNTGAQP
jgi:hypothetical protein